MDEGYIQGLIVSTVSLRGTKHS